MEPIPSSELVKVRSKRRVKRIHFQNNLMRFTELTKEALDTLNAGEPIDNLDQIGELYTKWRRCFIIDYKLHFKESAPGIFATLCQAKFLMQIDRIKRETKRIRRLNKFPDEDLLVRRKLRPVEETPENPDKNEKPIMMYSQSDVMDALMYVTERLNHLERKDIEHYEPLCDTLFTRCSVLFCEFNTAKVFDVPNMRMSHEDGTFSVNADFCKLCTIYFNAIQRRFFYHKMLQPIVQNFEGDASRLKKLFETEICKFLGPESVEDLYVRACEEAYAFPGDLEWFEYMYPAVEPTIGYILEQARPLYAKSFFTESRVSQTPILAGVTSDHTHRGYCCRTFVLIALDCYLAAKVECNNWRNCVVISNKQLGTAEAQAKIVQRKMPILLQVMSRFWVIDRKNVWATDCIYEAVVCWARILKERYNSKLLDRDFTTFIEKIL